MTRSKRAHGIGYFMGRYIVGPLIVIALALALAALCALLAGSIAQMIVGM